jgi:O-antigen/teichoic acid export membrane protein
MRIYRSLRRRFSRLEMSRMKRLSQEGGWIVAGQIVSVLGSFVLVRILTEYLKPSDYGYLALGLTIASLVNQVAMGGVISGISRFYSIAVEKDDLRGYLKSSWLLMVYATLAVSVISILLMLGLMWTHQTHWLSLAAAVLVFSVLSGFNAALSGVQNAARQRVVVALHAGIDAWLRIILAVGVIFWLGRSSTAAVVGYIISTLLVTASQLVFLRRQLHPHLKVAAGVVKDNWMKQMWLFSWPMIAGGLFNWSYYASQRWALELYATTEEVGKFYALTQIAYTPILLAGGMLISFITPILYARVGDPTNHERLVGAHQVIFRIAGIGLIATILAAIVTYFLKDIIFGVFVSSQYRDVSAYMPMLVVAGGLLQISLTMSTVVSVRNKTKLFLPVNIFGNLIFSIMNLYATSTWGMTGLIYAMVLGALLHLLWITAIVNRLIK